MACKLTTARQIGAVFGVLMLCTAFGCEGNVRWGELVWAAGRGFGAFTISSLVNFKWFDEILRTVDVRSRTKCKRVRCV